MQDPQSHVMIHLQLDSSQLGDKLPEIHKLGMLMGLYKIYVCRFNPDWKIPDFTDTHLSEAINQEVPSRTWKYLSPAKFWPKGISYFPVHAGVKVKIFSFLTV